MSCTWLEVEAAKVQVGLELMTGSAKSTESWLPFLAGLLVLLLEILDWLALRQGSRNTEHTGGGAGYVQ